MTEHDSGVEVEERAPFGGSWRRLYLVVLANLGFWIAVMAAATWAFS